MQTRQMSKDKQILYATSLIKSDGVLNHELMSLETESKEGFEP